MARATFDVIALTLIFAERRQISAFTLVAEFFSHLSLRRIGLLSMTGELFRNEAMARRAVLYRAWAE
jgi:hypothetical protein